MVADSEQIEIPGSTGAAVPVAAGQALRLVNTHGSQVVDTWALSRSDRNEYLSVEHTRRLNETLCPVAGDRLWSNRRQPMLRLEEDSFGGPHDTLVAACDRWTYASLGCPPDHASCQGNFARALAGLGIEFGRAPNPVNLWMNVPVQGDRVTLGSPLSRPGDHVLLRALTDVVMVFSACPMDLLPVNGPDMRPKSVHYSILDAGAP